MLVSVSARCRPESIDAGVGVCASSGPSRGCVALGMTIRKGKLGPVGVNQAQLEVSGAVQGGEAEVGVPGENPISTGGMEFTFRRSRSKCEDPRACRFTSANSGGGVLEDDTIGGREAE